jgi:hypothetical protein
VTAREAFSEHRQRLHLAGVLAVDIEQARVPNAKTEASRLRLAGLWVEMVVGGVEGPLDPIDDLARATARVTSQTTVGLQSNLASLASVFACR